MKKYCGATAILVIMMMAAFAGVANAEKPDEWSGNGSGGENGDRPDDPGAYELNQDVVFGEKVFKNGVEYGIYMDGTLFPLGEFTNSVTLETWDMTWEDDVSVSADWSDNLVLHEWDLGDKIRTEVVLICDDVVDASLFTITASFKIETLISDVWVEVWYGTTVGGFWQDGPVDAYSAEVNQNGVLLYGYNWDTKTMAEEQELAPGQYKLTFTLLALSETLPEYNELGDDGTVIASYDIDYSTVGISGTVDALEGSFLTDIDSTSTSTWIEITLN